MSPRVNGWIFSSRAGELRSLLFPAASRMNVAMHAAMAWLGGREGRGGEGRGGEGRRGEGRGVNANVVRIYTLRGIYIKVAK